MSEERVRPELRERVRIWLKRTLVALLIAGLLVLVFFIGRAFLPRWWSHRVGDQVHGSIAAGILLGLFYGFVFTFAPLFVLWRAFRKRRGWRVWAAYFVGAVLLAAPNLLTLGIVLGRGNAAHAGERTLDVEAPAFRWSVLIGAIAAVLVFAALYYLLVSRRLARGRMARLQQKLRAFEKERSEPREAAPAGNAESGEEAT